MTTEIVQQLTMEEAQALTDQIRTTTETLWELLTKAKEGNAPKALGYDSWKAYVQAEFGLSKPRSYQLLHQGLVIMALAEAVQEGQVGQESTMVDSPNINGAAARGTIVPTPVISERAARNITPEVLPQVATEVREAVASGVEPEQAIMDAVSDAAIAYKKEALTRAALESFHEPTPDLDRVHQSTATLVQKWELTALVPAIMKVHGRRDVEIECNRLSKTIETLMEIKEVMQGALAKEIYHEAP